MSEVEPSLELMRKRFSICQQVYNDCLSAMVLYDAAAAGFLTKDYAAAAKKTTPKDFEKFRQRAKPIAKVKIITTRGGDGDEEDAPKPTAARGRPVKVKTKAQEAAEEKRAASIPALAEQSAWLRAAMAYIDGHFSGKHADTLRKEMQEMGKEISNLLDAAVADRKFKTSAGSPPPPTEVYNKAVAEAVKLLKASTRKTPTVSEIMTMNSKNVIFYTTLIYVRGVTIAKEEMDFYALAVSEDLGSSVSTRKHWLTHLPAVVDRFDPALEWQTLPEFTGALKVLLDQHFTAKAAAEEKKITPKARPKGAPAKPERYVKPKNVVRKAIPGVASSEIVNNTLRVTVKGNANPTAVAEKVYKAVAEQIGITNPKYKGKLKQIKRTVNDRDTGKPATVLSYSTPLGSFRPKFANNDTLKYLLNIASVTLDLNNLQLDALDARN